MVAKITILSIVLIMSLANMVMAKKEGYGGYVSKLDPKELKLKKEKLTHFHLYWHDTVGGKKPTSVAVLPSVKNGSYFGMVHMFDNPLTVGPDLKSELVGRSQGLYASAAQDQVALLMAMNFAFTHGEYNGSAISILGRNTILQKVRELSIIGGSGRFRFATGYALAKTHYFNPVSFDAIVEYHIYVLHY